MSIPKIYPISIAAAAEQSSPIRISNSINGSYNVTVSDIGTNVVLRAEYSLDGGTTWTNCNAADTTITADGQYIIPIMASNVQPPLVRLNWVSTSGGTPTVTGELRIIR